MSAPETARRMETDAVAFYSKAAELTAHPGGKAMFLSIMRDEERHIAMIECILKGMAEGSQQDPITNVRTVFEAARDLMNERLPASSAETDALTTAMDMEREGYEFYQRSAREATDPKVRALFERLAIEEDKHYRMFSNTLNFLKDTGNWYMWEEHSIVEG